MIRDGGYNENADKALKRPQEGNKPIGFDNKTGGSGGGGGGGDATTRWGTRSSEEAEKGGHEESPDELSYRKFDIDTALWLAKHAQIAYFNPTKILSDGPSPIYKEDEFDFIASLRHREYDRKIEHDAEAYVFRTTRKDRPAIIVAFRGSEFTKVMQWPGQVGAGKDWMKTNFSFRPAKPKWNWVEKSRRGYVHRGFAEAYEEIQLDLKERVCQSYESHLGRTGRIFFTGHSLGGALAIISALHMWSIIKQKYHIENPLVSMYNFASPPVGNQTFVNYYNECIHDSHRCVIPGDIVPELKPDLPQSQYYEHVNEEHILDRVKVKERFQEKYQVRHYCPHSGGIGNDLFWYIKQLKKL